ncbi:hypothetical protein FOC1_g10003573 [Fusarium oxysporum f. sp. cubense race 1]|uniref:Uncharacterized protein n=1 Tax=Fusarium oxysporum f. sp. cubense (strain race 1) TaxID=1229664 RepID=N4V109_FUSC1|nr:hypothetical protein FOC1_g10003573 [Fusarium oxysporum f. sp. cubense race 1]
MEKWWNELCEAQVKQLPLLPNPPQRLETMTSLEITWTLKSYFTADHDYDNMDERHLKSIFDLLSPSKFPALRRLHIWFAKSRTAWLSVHGIEAYEKVIFEHLDSFVQFRRDLQELRLRFLVASSKGNTRLPEE